MGNEDVVVCKTKCYNSKEVSDLAEIEAVQKGIDDLVLHSKDGDDEMEKRLDFVQLLPMELIEEIYQYLEPRDLAACTAVSSAWREAVNSNKVWAYLCDKNGWKDDFDPNFSHFYKAHKQFRKWAHSYDSFSPICQKRLLFNKHSCLQHNWRCGKYIMHKINHARYLQLPDPVSCDGRYLVMHENTNKNGAFKNIGVWSLDGVPFRLCNLALPHAVQPVDAIAFDHSTIAIAQAWKIIVYFLTDGTFRQEYVTTELSNLEPKNRLLKDMKRMVPYLKVTQDRIICVPSHSHSTVGFLPIFFWDRLTGELKNQLTFDSMYYQITNAVWFGDSCYLSLTNKKTKTYQVVEFGLKTAVWEPFSQSVTVEVEQLVVSSQYILAVTKINNPVIREYFSRTENNNKELWLWDRSTGSALKTFEAQGKSFQFLNDYLMYFDSSRVTVMNPKAPDMCSEFEVSGTISSIRATGHPSLIVIIKTGCYIEVWDWGRGCRLYTVTAETGYGSQLWCDDKRILTYYSADSGAGGGVLVLGFW